jgi:nicotinamide phosphoribosyltransferase
MKLNPLTRTDFYKVGHKDMYPLGTTLIYSNFTPRSSKLADVSKGYDEKIVFFGLQGVIKSFLIENFNDEFFSKPKEEVVRKYKRRLDNSLGKNAVGVRHIEALHDLGYLPVQIKALPEGSRVNIKVPVLTIQNTKPEFFWLTNYLESALSSELWKPCTSATTAFEYRKIFEKYAEETGASKTGINFQGHDFSFRGMSGTYDALASGAAHLLSFWGTDTIPAIDYLEDYYNANSDKDPIAFSVPATEHSIACSNIANRMKFSEINDTNRAEAEKEFISDLLKQYPSGIISYVADTYDYWKVITEILPSLKDEINSRIPDELGLAKLTIRPDSGHPVKIVCGDIEILKAPEYVNDLDYLCDVAREKSEDIVSAQTDHGNQGEDQHVLYYNFKGRTYKIVTEINWNRYDKQFYYIDGSSLVSCEEAVLTPQQKGSIECLWDTFGGTINEKGFKVLNQRIGLIYGDSITLSRAEEIMQKLKAKGFSSENIIYGIGSCSYSLVTRDSYGFAMKATYAEIDGNEIELYKDPKTDSGTKKSAKGLLRVEKEGDNFVLYDKQTKEQESQGELQIVFKDGKLVKETSLTEIRKTLLGN